MIINYNFFLILVNILGIVTLFIIRKSIAFIFLFLLFINLGFWIFRMMYKKYKWSLERKKMELALLDEVLVLSSQPRTNDLKQILHKLSISNHKIVSKEFMHLKKKIEGGHNIKEIFAIFSKKYNSEIVDRFLEILYNSITTGTVSTHDYRAFTNNFLKTKQLIDERNSALLMQKYTIIFAGGFIVPGILGTVISLVKKLTVTIDFSTISQATQSTNSFLFSVCYYCSIVYIIEYVIISAIYLSMLESNLRKAVLYVIILLPIAISMFFLGSLI